MVAFLPFLPTLGAKFSCLSRWCSVQHALHTQLPFPSDGHLIEISKVSALTLLKTLSKYFLFLGGKGTMGNEICGGNSHYWKAPTVSFAELTCLHTWQSSVACLCDLLFYGWGNMAFGKVNDLVGWVLQLVDDPYINLIVIEYSESSVKTCSCVFLMWPP